jgi:transcriptional regulator with XRE-family HTH domain
MTRGYSTPCARELGYEMRIWRQRAGLSATEVSRYLGWSLSKTSRAELGMYRISEVELVHYLAACKVPHEQVWDLRMLKQEEERNLGYWVRAIKTGQVSDRLRSLVYHESTAIRSISYEPEVIPGLLQTEDYASALIRAAEVSAEEFAAALKARMDRQAILQRRETAEFTFYIHENALRLPVGDQQIMHEQLLHLVFSTTRQRLGIRVVPVSAGARLARTGDFRLFEYAKEHRPVIYLDGRVGALFLDEDSFVASYRELVTKLDAIALDEGQSREFLASLASDHDRVRGVLDAQLEEEQL